MNVKDTFFSKKATINCGGNILDISSPVVMGILNVTPDSFYDGGRYLNEKSILKKVEEMISEGAAIIDVGAYSSRPGAKNISEEEELERLRKALKPIRKNFENTIISVDTFRANVAKKVIDEFNVNMINDISAGDGDKAMFEIILSKQVPYIIMHMQGTPQSMQKSPTYNDVVKDIIKYFSAKVSKLKTLGVNDVILDPGFGFGKSIEHNYILLKNLELFNIFELPLLIGISRKSMIYKILDLEPDNALNGTTVIHTIALLKGASIIRVHDVKEAVEAIKLVNNYNSVI